MGVCSCYFLNFLLYPGFNVITKDFFLKFFPPKETSKQFWSKEEKIFNLDISSHLSYT